MQDGQSKREGRVVVDTPSPEELHAFEPLQDLFAAPTFVPHFDPSRRLGVDVDASTQYRVQGRNIPCGWRLRRQGHEIPLLQNITYPFAK